MIKDLEAVNVLIDDLNRLKEIYPQWKYIRRKTIEQLIELSKYLHEVERGVAITSVTTAAVGIPIGITAIVSGVLFLAAPVTGGISAVAGVIVAGAGVSGAVVGAVGIAANLAQFGIKRSKAKELEQVLKDDSAKTKEITDLLKEISEMFKKIDLSFLDMDSLDLILTGRHAANGAFKVGVGIGKGTFDTVQAGIKLGNFVRNGEAVADATIEGVSTIANLSKFSKLFAVAGIVGSGIGITFDVFSIVWNSIKIHKGSKCELGNKIDKIVGDLEKETEEFIEKYEDILVD